VVENLPVGECPLAWPVIVKPAFRDASIGIDKSSIVHDQAQLRDQVARVARHYGLPVLVERFIRGREISLAVIGDGEPRPLTVAENLLRDAGAIMTYDAKWRHASAEYQATPVRFPAELSAGIAEQLGRIACRAFGVLGCRDFATADCRLDENGEPQLLEINPNPNLLPSAYLDHALAGVGMSYAGFLAAMCRAAAARGTVGVARIR
jgi:D-alanine-D-alanine ligase